MLNKINKIMTKILKSYPKRKLAWGSTIYQFLFLRNMTIHGGQCITEESMLRSIQWEVRFRINNQGKFKNSILNRSLCFPAGS